MLFKNTSREWMQFFMIKLFNFVFMKNI